MLVNIPYFIWNPSCFSFSSPSKSFILIPSFKILRFFFLTYFTPLSLFLYVTLSYWVSYSPSFSLLCILFFYSSVFSVSQFILFISKFSSNISSSFVFFCALLYYFSLIIVVYLVLLSSFFYLLSHITCSTHFVHPYFTFYSQFLPKDYTILVNSKNNVYHFSFLCDILHWRRLRPQKNASFPHIIILTPFHNLLSMCLPAVFFKHIPYTLHSIPSVRSPVFIQTW